METSERKSYVQQVYEHLVETSPIEPFSSEKIAEKVGIGHNQASAALCSLETYYKAVKAVNRDRHAFLFQYLPDHDRNIKFKRSYKKDSTRSRTEGHPHPRRALPPLFSAVEGMVQMAKAAEPSGKKASLSERLLDMNIELSHLEAMLGGKAPREKKPDFDKGIYKVTTIAATEKLDKEAKPRRSEPQLSPLFEAVEAILGMRATYANAANYTTGMPLSERILELSTEVAQLEQKVATKGG